MKGNTPTRNEKGEMVQLNMEMINMIIPLYLTFDFIEDVRVFNDEKIDVDLDIIRKTYVGMPKPFY